MQIYEIIPGREYNQLISSKNVNWNKYIPYTHNRIINEDRVKELYNKFCDEIQRTQQQPLDLVFKVAVFNQFNPADNPDYCIIDGQHRYRALRQILDENPLYNFVLTFRITVHRDYNDANEYMMKLNDVVKWDKPFLGSFDEKEKIKSAMDYIRERWPKLINNKSNNPHRPCITDQMLTDQILSIVKLFGNELIPKIEQFNTYLRGKDLDFLHAIGHKNKDTSGKKTTQGMIDKIKEVEENNRCYLGLIRHRNWADFMNLF